MSGFTDRSREIDSTPVPPGPDGFDEIIEIEEDLRRQRRRFWRRVLLGLLGLVIVAVILAPRLASLDGPRERLLAVINRRSQPLQIHADNWQLRWLGSQTFDGLTLDHPDGAAAIERVRLDAGLLRLIPMGRVDLGTLTLTRPSLTLRHPAAASDATGAPAAADRRPRRAAAPVPAGETPARRLPLYDLAVDLRIIDGAVTVERPRGEPWRIGRLQTTLNLPSLRQPCEAGASWEWEPGGGAVTITGTVQTVERLLLAPDEAAGQLQLRLADHQLTFFAPWLLPVLGGVTPRAGGLEATLRLTAGGQGRFTAEATTEVTGFQATLPHEERPAMPPAAIRFAAQAAWSHERFTLTEAALVSPWATANGQADLARQPDWGTHPEDDARLDLRVELAPFLRDWGALLALAPGVAVTDGRLLADVRLGNDLNGFWARASAVATNLVVKTGTESSRFHPPPSLDLLVRRPAPQHWQVEQVRLDSAFARLAGSGSITQAVVTGSLDLTRLARDLHGLLPQLPRMVGRIDLHAESGRAGEAVQARGRLGFTDVAVDGGGAQPWVIEAGTLTAAASLPRLPERGWPREFERIALRFAGTPGTLTGSCDRCVLPPGTNRWAWRVERGRLQADADLARTLTFLRPLFSLPPKAGLAGHAVMGLACEAAAGTVKVTYNGAVQQLRLTSPAWNIREPDARLQGAAEWSAPDRLLRLANLTGRASFGTLEIPRATIGPATVQGDLKANLNLAPLAGWRQATGDGQALQAAGTVSVEAQAASDPAGSRLHLAARGQALAFTTGTGFHWEEPAPALEVTARLPPGRNPLALERLMLTNALGYLTGTGTVTNGPDPHLQLDGDLALDAAAAGRLLRSRGLREPRLQGFQPRPFSLSAPLGGGWRGALAVGQARLAFFLEDLQGWGIDAGPADLEAELADGLLSLRYAPPLASGTLQSRFRVDVGARPLELQLDEQALLMQDLPLSPALMQNLRFLNPLLANCTAIEGKVSVVAGNGRLPLDATYTTRSDFDVEIGLRDAVLMPTGVLEQILAYTGAGGKTLELRQERLRGTCRNGRIEIAPHQAKLRDHPVTFQGSVGLDQSLRFQTVVPLTEDLVGEKAAPYIAGQTLTVPVRGTVDKPRIDEAALAREARKLAATAAQRAMAEQAGELLEKLRQRVE